MTATETPTMPRDRTAALDGSTPSRVPDDACTTCGGPLRADLTAVQCPNYVGSTGVCWDCHLERTEGRTVEAMPSSKVRGIVMGSRGAESLCRAEQLVGVDDDLSGGCFVSVM